jgi:hypothetical protein
VVTYPDWRTNNLGQIEKNVDHVAVFVKERSENLYNTRTLLTKLDVAVKLGFELIQNVHD